MAWLVAPGNHVATLDTREPSTVGSHPACTLVMKEELGIALQHYRIVPYGSEAAELHSLAPLGMEVMLNGQAIDHEPLPLSDRDTITTGELKLIFRLTDPALDEIKPTALLEKNFAGETPTGQAAREIAASDAPVPVFQTPAPVAGESNLSPLALQSLENAEPTGPGQLPEEDPFAALEAAPAAGVIPTQTLSALPAGAQPAQAGAVPVPVGAQAAPMTPDQVSSVQVPVVEPVAAAAPAPLPAPAPLQPSLAPAPAQVAPEPLPAAIPAAVAPLPAAPVPVAPAALAAAEVPSPAPNVTAPPVLPAEIAPQVNPIPVPQETVAQVAPVPVDPAPPSLPVPPEALPVAPQALDAPPLPGETQQAVPAAAPPISSHSARPAELFLPKKAAPKRATNAGRRADAARRSSMRWGFRMLGIFAATAWILVAVYVFVDPARNVVNDLIGFDPLAESKIEQIEATVEAKNPAPAEAAETTPSSGVADQD